MKTHEIARRVVVLALLAALCKVVPAQKPDCGEVDAMAKMSRAISSKELTAEKSKAGDSYRAQVIYAVKLAELYPEDRNTAVRLLNLIPRNDEEYLTLTTLGDQLCGTESYSEMKTLGQIMGRLPRDLTRAVLLAPDRIPEYVAYSITSVQDLHSDYAMQMQKVCRAKHSQFIKAVMELPEEKRDQFLKYIFDPEGCNALTLPEGE
jgi:hypothetical protein